MTDPHYQKILDALSGSLDPHLFEDCVADLLREAYPTLVPIHGGKDAGMDGAIADGEGEAYSLVTTTAQDVIRNLTRNLESYLENEGPRRRVVLATSTALTPQRHRNLEERARTLGFTLVQVHGQRDLANRLYSSSRWTKELLGMSGQPSALSQVPETRRPLREIELIGREDDLEWLRKTDGDRLIVGQPGSGKTYLLYQLVQEGKGLFLVSDDEAAIANAVRDLRPEIVLVDDAHVDLSRLDRLRRVRTQIRADFDILAATWPGADDEVADALGIGGQKERKRSLELLTRKQVMEVLRAVGVDLADDAPFLRLLVDQSANKPGLAVLVGSLFLRGQHFDIATGKALGDALLPSLKRILGHDPTLLLACFALGGDRGVSVNVVRDYLGLDRVEMRRRVAGASQGGVLSVRGGGDRLSVEPEPLRSVLLDKVFFTAPAENYRELLDSIEHSDEVTNTLIQAAHRSVAVSDDELRRLLQAGAAVGLWKDYALLGGSEAEWVVTNCPEPFLGIADAILQASPSVAVPRLLEAAESAEQAAHPRSPHPLGVLGEWLRELVPLAESMRRRRQVVVDSKQFLQRGGERKVALRAMLSVMSPEVHSAGLAATGDRFRLHQGRVPPSAASDFLALWAEIEPDIHQLDGELWLELTDVLWGWVHPLTAAAEPLDKDRRQVHRVPRRMLQDLSRHGAKNPALAAELTEWAYGVDLDLGLERDPTYETLFPPGLLSEEGESYEERHQRELEEVRALAAQWAERDPLEAVTALADYEADAKEFGTFGTGRAREFALELSKSVRRPEEWLDAFLRRESTLGSWFLRRVVEESRPNWQRLLRSCLDASGLEVTAVELVLTRESPPPELLDQAMDRAWPELIEDLDGIPEATMRRLLSQSDVELVAAAVVSEWLDDPRGGVREGLRRDWLAALAPVPSREEVGSLRSTSVRYWMDRILRSDAEAAKAWLDRRLENRGAVSRVSPKGLFSAAVRALDEQCRLQVLEALRPGENLTDGLLPDLVKSSAKLFQALLGRKDLWDHHLIPLEGSPPDSHWVEMAEMALGSGHSPETIARASFGYQGPVARHGVEHWKRWQEAFAALSESSEGPMRAVAEEGLSMAQEKLDRAKEERRQFELTGAH